MSNHSPGWYHTVPNDNTLYYWDGEKFTGQSSQAPAGQEYPFMETSSREPEQVTNPAPRLNVGRYAAPTASYNPGYAPEQNGGHGNGVRIAFFAVGGLIAIILFVFLLASFTHVPKAGLRGALSTAPATAPAETIPPVAQPTTLPVDPKPSSSAFPDQVGQHALDHLPLFPTGVDEDRKDIAFLLYMKTTDTKTYSKYTKDELIQQGKNTCASLDSGVSVEDKILKVKTETEILPMFGLVTGSVYVYCPSHTNEYNKFVDKVNASSPQS